MFQEQAGIPLLWECLWDKTRGGHFAFCAVSISKYFHIMLEIEPAPRSKSVTAKHKFLTEKCYGLKEHSCLLAQGNPNSLKSKERVTIPVQSQYSALVCFFFTMIILPGSGRKDRKCTIGPHNLSMSKDVSKHSALLHIPTVRREDSQNPRDLCCASVFAMDFTLFQYTFVHLYHASNLTVFKVLLQFRDTYLFAQRCRTTLPSTGKVALPKGIL